MSTEEDTSVDQYPDLAGHLSDNDLIRGLTVCAIPRILFLELNIRIRCSNKIFTTTNTNIHKTNVMSSKPLVLLYAIFLAELMSINCSEKYQKLR